MAAIFAGSPLTSPTSSATAGGSRRPSPVVFVTIPSPPSLYELLRVKETASPGEIKTAYRSLAKQLHPDVAGERSDDGPDFVIVHRAYKTLSDPAAQAKYDLSVGRISLAFVGHLRMRPRKWETDQCWLGLLMCCSGSHDRPYLMNRLQDDVMEILTDTCCGYKLGVEWECGLESRLNKIQYCGCILRGINCPLSQGHKL